ncbi:MAG: hypothetical protein OXH12_03580 [Chloroflexi bacterium]|nr:hypothetical protein [Chloroflexota bacterium]MCY3602139.1 hypothetical protein [Chloroflexota bacterium]
MRTTLNIDLHIHRELCEYAAEKGISLSEAASYLLATGLKKEAAKPPDAEPFERPAWHLGTIGPAGVDLSDWAAVKEFLFQEDLDHDLGSGHRESQHRQEPRSA